jgi:hypothetical protein
MGLFDIGKSITAMVNSEKQQQQERRNASDAKKDYWARIEASNWEPEYASQHAPKYQQTQSPVARAYLESFLTGSNADSVQGTRLGGTAQKQTAQNAFDKTYGGWDQLQAQGRAERNNNERFRVTPIERLVRDADKEIPVMEPWMKPYQDKLGRPLTSAEAEAIKRWQGGFEKGALAFGTKVLDTKKVLGDPNFDDWLAKQVAAGA